jgi:uncharacterized protein (DUF433 family)
MDFMELISVDPAICHGQACIRETRIPVSVILDGLAEGTSQAEIVTGYPTLTETGVRAAAAYGASPAPEELVLLREP